ncbi:protein stoned-B-like [Uloborus diversus]|uniref:protein stoned-B-like n=1 Tax=Uloborus diversus TaxID=327109 RepID=UPI002409B901|nr:protein stoned-B-like [Uloborus diversus]
MNFIKKKLKSHKKDDEEEEYEKAVYEQSLHPQNPDQKMKNTEEWQFFQQLSMKVQDTVQKTQTTLSKLKDTRQEDEDEDRELYENDNELLSKGNIPPYGTGKVLRAPPRPPPPAGEKSLAPDLDFGGDFSQSSPSKGPPRPPPPGSSESPLSLDSSALQGAVGRGFGSPARPPPPNVAKFDNTHFQDNYKATDLELSDLGTGKDSTSFSLLDEFGFNSEPVVSSTNANMQDLLFLDDKEEVDPFDTSFVDVNNITSVSEQKNGTKKASENSFNPFSSSSVSNEWLNDAPKSVDTNKKALTNPFFSGLMDEPKPSSNQDNVHSLSSHNPFSLNDPIVNSSENDLFGLNIAPSFTKDNVADDVSLKAEESRRVSVEHVSENLSDISNSGSKSSNLLEDIISQDTCSPAATQMKRITEDATDVWQDENDHTSVFPTDANSNVPITPEKTLEASLIWDSDTLHADILVPEKHDAGETQSKMLETNEEASLKNEPVELSENSFVASNEPGSDSETLPYPQDSQTNNGPIQPTSLINAMVSDVPSSKESDISGFSSEAFGSSATLEEHSHRKTSDASEGFEVKLAENSDIVGKAEVATMENDSFSKPFEGESEENAFLFKVKSSKSDLEFDAFAAKFENVKDSQETDPFDPFMSKRAPTLKKIQENYKGFDSMDEFDPFKVSAKAEETLVMKKESSRDSFEDYDNEVDFSVVIRPKVKDSSEVTLSTMEPPKLLPPPKTPTKAFESTPSRFNPFDKDFLDLGEISKVSEKGTASVEAEDEVIPALGEAGVRKADSIESPLSPLFDDDTSLPLETFPKKFDREGWEMVLRQPNKKKLTGNRFWKKIFVKLSENSVLQLFNKIDDKLPFQELPLQACYSLSEIGAQQYDQYGKIFTVKLQYKFYRERVGVRPGQISKVTQGQVTSMGDVAKLGLPLQHSAQTSQLLKLGSQSYSDMQLFIQEVEDALFRMVVHRDRVLTYKTEEVQVIAQDEFYVEQSKTGHIDKQLARVRIFFLAFITGMPSVEVGLNDIIRQGKEVVGRYDIIPVVTEEWIRLEDCEFHSCVIQDEFYKNRVIKFHPPDACLFELLRFRIRPPKRRELPLQVRVFMTVSNTRVEIRSDILVPGYSSRKQGQVPCENIQIRFPVPECWIYLFRTEKHFRYGSKKSTARRPGKIKGLERIIGAAQNLDPSLIEVSAGQAKYEHVFHAVVWRIPRLPKEGQGAYTQQLFLLRTELTSFDQIPETFEQYVDVEFTMPATYVSHTTVRSVSVTNPIPPEKYVRYISKHEYKVEIDFKSSSDEIDGLMSSPNVSAPVTTTPAVQESTEEEEKDDDSD